MDFEDYQALKRGEVLCATPKKTKKKRSKSKSKHQKKRDSQCSGGEEPQEDAYDSDHALVSPKTPKQRHISRSSSASAAATPRRSGSGFESTLSKFFNQEERLHMGHRSKRNSDDDDDDYSHDMSTQSAPAVIKRKVGSHHHYHHHRPPRKPNQQRSTSLEDLPPPSPSDQQQQRSSSLQGLPPPPLGVDEAPVPTKRHSFGSNHHHHHHPLISPRKPKLRRNKSSPSSALRAMVSPLSRSGSRRFSFDSTTTKPDSLTSISSSSGDTQSLSSSWSSAAGGNGSHGGGWREWEKSPPKTKKKSYLKDRQEKEQRPRRNFLANRVSNVIGKEDAFAMLMLREFEMMDF